MSEVVNVSDEFMEFYGKEAEAIAEAQKAEATSGNIPFDIGTQGTVIVKSVEFGRAKDKEIDDPNAKGLKITKRGLPTIKFKLLVIDHPQYSGVEFVKTWYMWSNATQTQVQTYKAFLDECEKYMGLTREVRENPNCTPQMLGDFFTKGDPLVTINFRVVENAKNTFDGGKQIYYSIPKEIIPQDSSVMPTSTSKEVASASTEGTKSFKIGDKVNYLEIEWTVETVLNDKVVLASPGVESKIVKMTALS